MHCHLAMSVAVARPLRGSRQHTFYPTEPAISLRSLDSAFQLQEYIALLIREDPHDVQSIVTLPKSSKSSSESKAKEKDITAQGDDRDEPEADESCWIYEHLRSVHCFVVLYSTS